MMYRFTVISGLACPIILEMVNGSTLFRYRFVANDLRPVWLVTNCHFSPVVSFPALKIVTVSLIPHLRQIYLRLALKRGLPIFSLYGSARYSYTDSCMGRMMFVCFHGHIREVPRFEVAVVE